MTDRETKIRPPARVAPLVPPALAAGVGVVVDRYGSPLETLSWVALAVTLAVLGLGLGRPRVLALAATWIAWGALAGAWHHARWSDLAPDDLARVVGEVPRPAWVRGVLLDVSGHRPGRGPDDAGVTRAVLEVFETHGGAWSPASGRAALTVEGDRSDLRAGDAVEVAGTVALVAGPLNPGEFDEQAYLRAQGVRLRFSADGGGVWVWEDPGSRGAGRSWWACVRGMGAVRAWSQATLLRGIDPAAAPLASALLLGRRDGIDPAVNDAFARTGTTHLLAISGLHLQVLAVTVQLALCAAGLSRRRTFYVVASAAIGYGLLVGLMPSVVRSVVMTVSVCASGLCDRRSRPADTLSLASLVTLGLNPSHLFDVGCQLSFLAVAAIYWGVPPVTARVWPPPDALARMERAFAPRWRVWLGRAGRWLVEGLIVSTVVWLAALPLVLLRFHIVSPVGVLLNLVLVPLTSLALLAAGVSLGLSAVSGPLGAVPGWVASWLLVLTDGIVRQGASWRWGHTFGPSPPWWWVLTLYALLALAAASALGHWRGRVALAGLSALTVPLGLLLLVRPDLVPGSPGSRGPGVDVLAVGHGLAVVIDAGPGRAWLYDCGRMRDPSVGRRVVAPALWARGVWRVDSVVISHADADHYNGLPDVLDRFRVGVVLVPPGFTDDPGGAALVGSVRSRGVPVREAVAGDSWSAGPFALRALHPPRDWDAPAADNARSVVLDVSAFGRHVLLTGDLDGPGLDAVLNSPRTPRPVDVLLSPHHGGRTANPAHLFDALTPAAVVVSQRPPPPGSRDPLADVSPLVRTWERGAALLTFRPSGTALNGFKASPDGDE